MRSGRDAVPERPGRAASRRGARRRGGHEGARPGDPPEGGGARSRARRRRRRSRVVDLYRRSRVRGDVAPGVVRRPQPPLRRAGARDGGDRQRDRLPRRVPPVRLDLPRLLRLHARRRSASRRLSKLPVVFVFTHDSIFVGRGRADPRADRARRLAPPHSRTSRCGARPTRSRPRWRGEWPRAQGRSLGARA